MNGNYGNFSKFRSNIAINPNVVVPSVNYGASKSTYHPLNATTRNWKTELQLRQTGLNAYRKSVGVNTSTNKQIILFGFIVAVLFMISS